MANLEKSTKPKEVDDGQYFIERLGSQRDVLRLVNYEVSEFGSTEVPDALLTMNGIDRAILNKTTRD